MDNNLIQSLKAFTKNTSRLTKMMQDYSKLREDVVENTYLLEKKVAAMTILVNDLPSSELKDLVYKWLDDEKKEINRGKDEFRFQFGNRLKDLLKSAGLDVRGQYPTLRFGLYTLKLNFELGNAVLYFGPEVERLKAKIPLQPRIIYDIVMQSERDLKFDKLDLENLSRDLRAAYENCLKRSERTCGDKIPITDVLREYVFMKQPKKFAIDARRENFREYPRAKLSFMLYQLRNVGGAEQGMRLHVATFDATTDRAKAIWVPETEEGTGTYYEYLSFAPPEGSS